MPVRDQAPALRRAASFEGAQPWACRIGGRGRCISRRRCGSRADLAGTSGAGVRSKGGAPAAVGAVRGRNGISFQSYTPVVDRYGFTRDPGPGGGAPPPGFVPKLVGTNMAVRRDVLRGLGGFDEAFRFYLEDTDLSLRLAAAGHVPVFVPLAEVQHDFAASARRTACRRPTSLVEIGRSLAIFLRKHGDPEQSAAIEEIFRTEERRRLLRHMVLGSCEPRDVRRLLDGFDQGIGEGRRAEFGRHVRPGEPPAFSRFPGLPDDGRMPPRRRASLEGPGAVGQGRRSGQRWPYRHADAVHPDHALSSPPIRAGGLLGSDRRDTGTVAAHRPRSACMSVRWSRPGRVVRHRNAQKAGRDHNPVTSPIDSVSGSCCASGAVLTCWQSR